MKAGSYVQPAVIKPLQQKCATSCRRSGLFWKKLCTSWRKKDQVIVGKKRCKSKNMMVFLMHFFSALLKPRLCSCWNRRRVILGWCLHRRILYRGSWLMQQPELMLPWVRIVTCHVVASVYYNWGCLFPWKICFQSTILIHCKHIQCSSLLRKTFR